MTSGCAAWETVVLSDADTEVLDASNSASLADAADSSPDDATARQRGGSVLGTTADALGVATLETQRAAGRPRLPV